MPEKREEDDDRDRHAQQPQKNASTHFLILHFLVMTGIERSSRAANPVPVQEKFGSRDVETKPELEVLLPSQAGKSSESD